MYQRGKFKVTLLLPLLLFCCIGCTAASHPSDAEMVKVLRNRRDSFDQLVRMAREDVRIWRITSDSFDVFTDSEMRETRAGTSQDLNGERLKEYRRLFNELNLDGGLLKSSVPSGDVIFFVASVRQNGLLHGDEKGYAYADGDLSPTENLLDDKYTDKRGNPMPLFRSVDSNWYLYYQND